MLNKQVLLRKVWCVSACVVCGLFEGPAVPWMSYFKRCRENVTIRHRHLIVFNTNKCFLPGG